jgi:hypothetical protein
MSRGLSAANETAIDSDVVAPILFAELNFESGYVRVHSALGSITWGGYEWLGVGTFGTISAVDEQAELAATTISYTLTGVPNTLLSVALNDSYQGRSAKLYAGFLSRTTYQLVGDPHLMHMGKMDVARAKIGNTSTLIITSESRIAAWSRPLVRRYTDAEQQAIYPGDKGLEFISQAAQKEVVWGRKA